MASCAAKASRPSVRCCTIKLEKRGNFTVYRALMRQQPCNFSADQSKSVRRPYAGMCLRRHGSLAELTRGGRKVDGKAKDDGRGSSPM